MPVGMKFIFAFGWIEVLHSPSLLAWLVSMLNSTGLSLSPRAKPEGLLFGKPVSTFPAHALSSPHVRARPRPRSSPPRSRSFRAVGNGAARACAGIDPDREGLCRSDLARPADRAL